MEGSNGIPDGFFFHQHSLPVPGCFACASRIGLIPALVTASIDKAAQFYEHADAKTRQMIRQACQKRQQIVAASRAIDGPDYPAPKGWTYLPFQRAGIQYALSRRGTILGDPPGAGKTIQALGVINASPSIKKVLIICPSTLRLNWQREAQKWLVRPLTSWVAGISPGLPSWTLENPTEPTPSVQLVITNFERVRGAIKQPVDPPGLLTFLTTINWDLLIVDEAHRIKNPKSQQGETVLKLIVPHAQKVLFLTGTPFDRPHQVKHLAEALIPGLEINDTRRPGEVQEILRATCLIRRTKEDVLPQLPPKRHQIIWLTPPRSLTQDDLTNPSCHFAQRSKLAKAKIPFIVDHLKGLLAEGVTKIACFVHHKPVVAALAKNFPRAIVLDGDTSIEDRQRAVDWFQRDPHSSEVKLFIGSMYAAGVGITLTAATHAVVGEQDWRDEVVSQVEDRCIAERQPVLTPDGWRPIENVKVGDHVITRDGSVGVVTDAWSRGSTKLMVEVLLEGWLTPVVTTDDHPFLVNGQWICAGQLRPGHRVAMPVGALTSRLESVPFDEACRLPKQFMGAGGEQTNGRLLSMPAQIFLTDEALFALGYFAGDGFASTVKGKGRFVSFSGNTGRKRASLERCRTWLETLGVASTIYTQPGHGLEMRGFSGELALWFRSLFGHGAANKRLPGFCLVLNREQSRQLLSGLMASDGYHRKTRYEYSTMSPVLAAHVALVILRAGFRPCVTHGSTGQTIVAYTDDDAVSQDALVRAVTTRFPRKLDGTRERVYDLTIDGSASFVVGMAVVHNCHRIGLDHPVLIQHLVFADSLDARMLELVLEKRQIAYHTLDQKPTNLPCDFSSTRTIDNDNARNVARLALELLLDSEKLFAQDRKVCSQILMNPTLSPQHTGLAHTLACHYRQLLPECILRHLTLVE